jgi:hypothetical protein
MSVTVIVPVLQATGAEQAQAQAAAALAQLQSDMAHQPVMDRGQIMRDLGQAQRELARAIQQQQFTMQPLVDMRHTRRQEGLRFAGFVVVVIAAVAIFRPLVRGFARRLEGNPSRDIHDLNGSAQRLERIEQAVEAMAVEIERISEGQRFTTRLLSSRADADASVVRRL